MTVRRGPSSSFLNAVPKDPVDPRSPARPLVGVPTQTLQSFGGIPADMPPSWVMSQRYIQTLADAGAIPVMLPILVDDAHPLRPALQQRPRARMRGQPLREVPVPHLVRQVLTPRIPVSRRLAGT